MWDRVVSLILLARQQEDPERCMLARFPMELIEHILCMVRELVTRLPRFGSLVARDGGVSASHCVRVNDKVVATLDGKCERLSLWYVQNQGRLEILQEVILPPKPSIPEPSKVSMAATRLDDDSALFAYSHCDNVKLCLLPDNRRVATSDSGCGTIGQANATVLEVTTHASLLSAMPTGGVIAFVRLENVGKAFVWKLTRDVIGEVAAQCETRDDKRGELVESLECEAGGRIVGMCMGQLQGGQVVLVTASQFAFAESLIQVWDCTDIDTSTVGAPDKQGGRGGGTRGMRLLSKVRCDATLQICKVGLMVGQREDETGAVAAGVDGAKIVVGGSGQMHGDTVQIYSIGGDGGRLWKSVNAKGTRVDASKQGVHCINSLDVVNDVIIAGGTTSTSIGPSDAVLHVWDVGDADFKSGRGEREKNIEQALCLGTGCVSAVVVVGSHVVAIAGLHPYVLT